MAARHKPIPASTWTPPEAMVRIARQRTVDILRTWAQGVPWGPLDFAILAQSCYMQGINDSIDALHQQGLEIKPVVPDEVWEGYCG